MPSSLTNEPGAMMKVGNVGCCGGFRGNDVRRAFRLPYRWAFAVGSWAAVRQAGVKAEGEFPLLRIN
jgi:hypothetical protein